MLTTTISGVDYYNPHLIDKKLDMEQLNNLSNIIQQVIGSLRIWTQVVLFLLIYLTIIILYSLLQIFIYPSLYYKHCTVHWGTIVNKANGVLALTDFMN